MGHTVCTQIASEAPAEVQKRSLEFLKQGVWLCYHDTLPKGGLPALKVPFTSVYYGVPIEHQTVSAIRENHRRLLVGHELLEADDPCVQYHGTAKSNLKSILEKGIQASDGMLGRAIYMGSFWKAYRQAVMNSEWEPRVGSVIRLLCFWQFMCLRNPDSPKCQCPKCRAWSESHGSSSVHPASDHLATWSKTHEAVVILPQVHSDGTWMVKNEEVACLSMNSIVIDSVGFVGTQALVTDRDPLKRDIMID